MADQITANPNATRDWAGEIVPGALLYTYATGTMTPLTVFRDVDATLPHPNPIEADASGVFPQIFFTGIVKGIVTDPDGVVLPGFPMDPLPRSVVGTSGASTISFLPTAEIPESDVQTAVERVQANLANTAGAGQGFLARNADGGGVRRTLTGTTDQIEIANEQGIAGNPVFSAVVPTQLEAEAGTNTAKLMTSQRTRQAVDARTGAGRVWQTVTRAADTNYQNTNAFALDVLVKFLAGGSAGTAFIDVGASTGAYVDRYAVSLSSDFAATATLTVPPGWFYRIRVTGGTSINMASERSL
jgi:hypothetical protein